MDFTENFFNYSKKKSCKMGKSNIKNVNKIKFSTFEIEFKDF